MITMVMRFYHDADNEHRNSNDLDNPKLAYRVYVLQNIRDLTYIISEVSTWELLHIKALSPGSGPPVPAGRQRYIPKTVFLDTSRARAPKTAGAAELRFTRHTLALWTLEWIQRALSNPD